jgi:hypothetical protein
MNSASTLMTSHTDQAHAAARLTSGGLVLQNDYVYIWTSDPSLAAAADVWKKTGNDLYLAKRYAEAVGARCSVFDFNCVLEDGTNRSARCGSSEASTWVIQHHVQVAIQADGSSNGICLNRAASLTLPLPLYV